MKTDLLIPAIPLIHGVKQYGDGEWRFLDLFRALERAIRRGIVNDQDPSIVFGERGWNPPEDILDGPFGVVRHDEDEYSGTHLIAIVHV